MPKESVTSESTGKPIVRGVSCEASSASSHKPAMPSASQSRSLSSVPQLQSPSSARTDSLTSLLARRAWNLRVNGLRGNLLSAQQQPKEHEELLDQSVDVDQCVYLALAGKARERCETGSWENKRTHARQRVDQLLFREMLLRGFSPLVTPMRASFRTSCCNTSHTSFREISDPRLSSKQIQKRLHLLFQNIT